MSHLALPTQQLFGAPVIWCANWNPGIGTDCEVDTWRWGDVALCLQVMPITNTICRRKVGTPKMCASNGIEPIRSVSVTSIYYMRAKINTFLKRDARLYYLFILNT